VISKTEYLAGRRHAAELMASFNRRACIHFAEVLRTHDAYERLCLELGIPAEDMIPQEYFEIVYKVLSFGKLQDRATLLLGTASGIERLVTEIQGRGGFNDEKGFFIEA
jgi:hypothetical protein